MDPDECLRSWGRERFQQMLDQSVGVFDFLMEVACRRYPMRNEAEEAVRAAQFVLPTIATVPNAMLRSEYVRRLAERLHLDEAAVGQELAKVKPRTALANAPPGAGARLRPGSASSGPERLLAALVLEEPARWGRVSQHVALDDITEAGVRRILQMVAELQATGQAVTPARLVSRLSDEAGLDALVSTLVALGQSVASKPDEAFEDCLRRLRLAAQKRRLEAVRAELRSAQDLGDEEETRRWLSKYQQLLSTAAEDTTAAVAQSQGG
jgi:DNA primase